VVVGGVVVGGVVVGGVVVGGVVVGGVVVGGAVVGGADDLGLVAKPEGTPWATGAAAACATRGTTKGIAPPARVPSSVIHPKERLTPLGVGLPGRALEI
jgi:hypothetical protein